MKKTLLFLLAASLLVACSSSKTPAELTGISINKSSIEIAVGDTYQLLVVYQPEEAADIAPAVSWDSDKTRTATVDDNGLVTAKKEGTATITAYCGKFNAECEVVVVKAAPKPEEPETPDTDPSVPKFAVSKTKKVVFSPGNLQYQPSTKKWRFAEHQFDAVGDDNVNISNKTPYDGWLDLFCWGSGNNPTEWELDGSNRSFVDWGSNIIYNGTKQEKGWRTLSGEEWKYLYSGRVNADEFRGRGCVNNVNGYIFLPTTWSMPIGLNAFVPDAVQFNTNSYTLAEWEKMESAGAVFLPAAGYTHSLSRTVDELSETGYYWSSGRNTYFPTEDADLFLFSSDYSGVPSKRFYYGCSVRLVKDYN